MSQPCFSRSRRVAAIACFAACFIAVCSAHATIVVTSNSNALSLATAVTAFGGPGIVVTNASLSSPSSGIASSTGTFSANGATYGLSGGGIVLSTGHALNYGSGPNDDSQTTFSYSVAASAAQNALLGPISGQTQHFDVTELSLTFNTLPGYDRVFFNVVFGSEEFPEFVSGTAIDAFGVFVNGTNVAFSGGFPVNIRHPDFASIAGTELDGVLAPGGKPVVTYSALVGSGTTGNTLRFILGDAGDSVLDTTAYISSLGGTGAVTVPEPTSLAIWAIGSAVLFRYRKRH